MGRPQRRLELRERALLRGRLRRYRRRRQSRRARRRPTRRHQSHPPGPPHFQLSLTRTKLNAYKAEHADQWLYRTQLESISISLGATPIDGHQPPEVKRPVKLVRREERGHPDWTSTFIVIHDADLRIDLTGSFACRLVAEGLVLYLAAREKRVNFDLEAWIAERAFDPWTPARMPGYSLDTKLRRPVMKIAGRRNVIFRDFEAFGIGSTLLLDRIMAEQSKHGRAHVIEHCSQILTKWHEARTAVQRRTRKGTTTPSPWPTQRAGSDS